MNAASHLTTDAHGRRKPAYACAKTVLVCSAKLKDKIRDEYFGPMMAYAGSLAPCASAYSEGSQEIVIVFLYRAPTKKERKTSSPY